MSSSTRDYSAHCKAAKICLFPENIEALAPQMPHFVLLSQGVGLSSPGPKLLLQLMNNGIMVLMAARPHEL